MKWIIGGFIFLLCSAIGVSGCFLTGEKAPPGALPEGTVLWDSDGNGIADVLAVDADGDGVADLVPVGQPATQPSDPPQRTEAQIVPNSAGFVTGLALDTKGPNILAWVAGAFGIPGLGLLATFWRKQKWAGSTIELIQNIQEMRRRLKEAGQTEALNAVDLALVHTEKTTAVVDKVKKNLKLPHVIQ